MTLLTQQARDAIARALTPGSIAVDATVGNGHDTLFLAEAVGNQGRVYGFDIQQTALKSTRARIDTAGFAATVDLINADHAGLKVELARRGVTRVNAFMFNLGYLPGSDKQLITRTESSLSALRQAVELVMVGGCISLIAYSGHRDGAEETQAIADYCKTLDPQQFLLHHDQPQGLRRPAPQWFLITRDY